MSETTEYQLPFSPPKQEAILGYLIFDDNFYKQAHSKIQPSWFVDTYAAKVLTAKNEFYKKHGYTPTIAELQETPNFLLEETDIRNKMLAKLNLAKLGMANFRLTTLMPELTTWLQTTTYFVGAKSSEDLFNKQRFPEAFAAMKRTLKEVDESSFDNDHEADFSNFRNDFELSQEQLRSAMTFGSKLLDTLLLPAAGGRGCLLPGDTTVIVAPTNTGKTTCAITVICENLLRQKSVMFMAHEGRKSDLMEKIWCSLLHITKAELLKLPETEEGTARLVKGLAIIKRYLVFIPYVKAGATIEDVEAIYRRKQDERVARYGKPFDLFVNDYPAKLTTVMARGGQWPKRNVDDYVYNYFVQLGLEYSTHSILLIQTNREGAKINKNINPDAAKRLLVGEDVQESFGVVQTATNVITLNRDPNAKRLGLITFYLDKSRSSETGFGVICKSDYGRAITHNDKLGGVWYQGTMVLTVKKRIEEIVSKYLNNEIPTWEVDLL